MRVIDILTAPWAIIPDRLLEIQAIYATHLRGDKIDVEALEARLGRPLANEQQDYEVRDDGVAVLAIEGVIANKANMFTRISGGVSAQLLARQVDSMRSDPRIKAVVLALDTPGGSVFGIPALGQSIRALAADKPTVAVSTGQMASAGYWLGAAANAVYVSGTTDVLGSIGVVATHTYNPRAGGAVTTEITAGRYKRIATDNAPLTPEGREYLQAQVDHMYSVFVEAVAENRGVSAQDVLDHMADGRLFIGQQAIDAGLADGIATVEQLVERLADDPGAFATRRTATISTARTARNTGAGAGPGAARGDAGPSDGGPITTTSGDGSGVALPDNADPASARTGDPVPAATATDHPQPGAVTMTPQEIAAQFSREQPLAHAHIVTEAANAERARILAVEAQLLPGHEALIATLKADGKTTGPEAAVQILAAEKASLRTVAADLRADAPKPAPAAPIADPAPVAKVENAEAPVEDRCKAKWDASASLRAEFGAFESFLAYTKAIEGNRVRVLKPREQAR